MKFLSVLITASVIAGSTNAHAATSVPFTIAMSEAVNVTGTPRIAVDVGGVTRYADYSGGTGTSALTFTYAMQAGVVDLDGVALSSPIDLNGGTIKDLSGNNATLTFTPPDTSNVKINYPSLGMDFVADADGRYTLNGTVYNDLSSFLTATGGSFTRNSIGTYFDSAGILQTATANQPRFDYDPVTHAAKGILIEERRINLMTYSEIVAPANWAPYYSTVSNNVTQSPNGLTTAEKIIPNSGSNTGGSSVSRSLGSLLDNTNYNFSFFAKAAEFTAMGIRLVTKDGNANFVNISLLSNNTFSNGPITNGLTETIGNGWVRISFTFNSSSGTTTPFVYLYVKCYCGNTGNGSDGLYLWGTQLEQGSFPTSYIPTTSAAVTREADYFTIPTGTWANNGPETMFASAALTRPQGNWSSLFVYDGSYPNNRYFLMGSNGTATAGYSGNPNVGTANTTAHNTTFNAAGTFTPTATMSVLNGGTVNTGAVSGNTTNTNAQIGGGNGLYLNGTLRQLKYYPTAISATQLQLMTQ